MSRKKRMCDKAHHKKLKAMGISGCPMCSEIFREPTQLPSTIEALLEDLDAEWIASCEHCRQGDEKRAFYQIELTDALAQSEAPDARWNPWEHIDSGEAWHEQIRIEKLPCEIN